MNIADKAVAASMRFEAKKNGLQQVQSGDWKLSLTVSPTDVPAPLLSAAMGTRYVVAIVEVDDEEQPVEQPQPDKKEDRHKLSRQAAMLCGENMFIQFLINMHSDTWGILRIENPSLTLGQTAAVAIRQICQVQSRTEFDTDPEAAARWRDLKGEFEAWKIPQ